MTAFVIHFVYDHPSGTSASPRAGSRPNIQKELAFHLQNTCFLEMQEKKCRATSTVQRATTDLRRKFNLHLQETSKLKKYHPRNRIPRMISLNSVNHSFRPKGTWKHPITFHLSRIHHLHQHLLPPLAPALPHPSLQLPQPSAYYPASRRRVSALANQPYIICTSVHLFSWRISAAPQEKIGKDFVCVLQGTVLT